MNIYTLYNLKSVAELQGKLRDRIALFVCDFPPVDYQAYFDELLERLGTTGIVICSQYSPVVGLLKGGQYNAIRRPLREGRGDVHRYLTQALTLRSSSV